MVVLLVWMVVSVVVCGIVGQRVGVERGHPGLGVFLGVLFSVFGLIAISVIPSTPEAEASRQLAVESRRRALAPARRSPGVEGWHPDPLGRHDERLWSGERWTRNVRDGGSRAEDPDPALDSLAPPR